MLSRLRSDFAFGCLLASGLFAGAWLHYRGLSLGESCVYVLIVLIAASLILDMLSCFGKRR